jgi:hypothetical protein
MMTIRQSCVPLLLAVQLGAISLMLSCASSRPPQRLTVHVAPGFSGSIRLSPCLSSAPATDIFLDDQGMAATSACPSRDASIEIVVLRGDQRLTITSDHISISRTGDGIPTRIQAAVTP